MRNDSGGGGAKPGLTAAEIMQATRGIRAITAVETEEWGQFPGPHMTVERMWALRNRIVEHLSRPEVTGVVITHGTDTLEESAYLVARSTASEKPIVFTGAMRTVSDLGWDGPANLFEAVQVAASEETRGFGVMVVIGGQIFAALDTTKTNTHLLDAFESPGLGPLGVLDEGELILRREMPPSPPILKPNALATPDRHRFRRRRNGCPPARRITSGGTWIGVGRDGTRQRAAGDGAGHPALGCRRQTSCDYFADTGRASWPHLRLSRRRAAPRRNGCHLWWLSPGAAGENRSYARSRRGYEGWRTSKPF